MLPGKKRCAAYISNIPIWRQKAYLYFEKLKGQRECRVILFIRYLNEMQTLLNLPCRCHLPSHFTITSRAAGTNIGSDFIVRDDWCAFYLESRYKIRVSLTSFLRQALAGPLLK